jgi:hypothetical protein
LGTVTNLCHKLVTTYVLAYYIRLHQRSTKTWRNLDPLAVGVGALSVELSSVGCRPLSISTLD